MSIRDITLADSCLITNYWLNDPTMKSKIVGDPEAMKDSLERGIRRVVEARQSQALPAERYVIIECEGEAVGFFYCARMQPPRTWGIHIHILSSGFRSRGIGFSAAMELFDDFFGRWQVDRFTSFIEATNAIALSLGKKCGFSVGEPYERSVNYYLKPMVVCDVLLTKESYLLAKQQLLPDPMARGEACVLT